MNTAFCGAYWSRRLARAVPDDLPTCSDCLRMQLDDRVVRNGRPRLDGRPVPIEKDLASLAIAELMTELGLQGK